MIPLSLPALVMAHQDWITQLAYQFRRCGQPVLDQDDLVQIGLMALCQEAPRFRQGQGCSLKSFVWLRVRGAMVDAIRGVHGRDRQHPTVSLDGDDERDAFLQIPDTRASPYEESMERERRALLEQCLQRLALMSYHVLHGYFLEGQSLRELGSEAGITESAMSFRKVDAIKALRKVLGRQHIREQDL